ncbi:MAG: NERD domain-containing protein [Kaiparowitsia implicata GSE-PSE-MK54-09C]|jgi:hypothetical protein|nr:NERD domain-containing protein [Kaiparowitsia implicata GSE-PSE-MK54-09C]
MVKRRKKAGANIRNLALNRRIKAITSVVGGFATAIALHVLFQQLFAFIPADQMAEASQTTPSLRYLRLLPYGILGLLVLGSSANGIYWWTRANQAAQGAKGEEDTAQTLESLEQRGWTFDYGMALGNRLGDADIVCTSPTGKAYVVDVKSHRGIVATDGKLLYRRIGDSKQAFEKDFLAAAMKQALQVKQQKQLSFVTPIVAFSDAKVEVTSQKLRGVYVVEKANLANLLQSLG